MTTPINDGAMETADESLHTSLVIFLLMEWARAVGRDFEADDASGRRWFGPDDDGAHGGRHDLFAVLAPPWLIDGIVAYMLSHTDRNALQVSRHATKAN